MNKPSIFRRSIKHVFYFFIVIVTLMIAVKMGFGLLGSPGQQIVILSKWKQAAAVMWIRYSIYFSIWFLWRPCLLQFNSTLSDDVVKMSRRPLIVLIISYELLIARDLPQLIMPWIG